MELVPLGAVSHAKCIVLPEMIALFSIRWLQITPTSARSTTSLADVVYGV